MDGIGNLKTCFWKKWYLYYYVNYSSLTSRYNNKFWLYGCKRHRHNKCQKNFFCLLIKVRIMLLLVKREQHSSSKNNYV